MTRRQWHAKEDDVLFAERAVSLQARYEREERVNRQPMFVPTDRQRLLAEWAVVKGA